MRRSSWSLLISFRVVTFKNSNELRSGASVPLDRMLVETDSPYLAPAFSRPPNEPAYVRQTAAALAALRRCY
jgi:TatD DNase family protein